MKNFPGNRRYLLRFERTDQAERSIRVGREKIPIPLEFLLTRSESTKNSSDAEEIEGDRSF